MICAFHCFGWTSILRFLKYTARSLWDKLPPTNIDRVISTSVRFSRSAVPFCWGVLGTVSSWVTPSAFKYLPCTHRPSTCFLHHGRRQFGSHHPKLKWDTETPPCWNEKNWTCNDYTAPTMKWYSVIRATYLILVSPLSWRIYISKTSRFYIGLAVGLPVFSNISIILTHVQTVLSLQGKATWLDR